MNTSDVLNRAADLIEERGWAKGNGWFPELLPPDAPLCVEGACDAASGSLGKNPAIEALTGYLGMPRMFPEVRFRTAPIAYMWVWNDNVPTDAAEVIEVLRACALIEAAREQQDAAWATYAELVSA